jgi:hypothetical protein
VEYYNNLEIPGSERLHRLYVERMQNLLIRPDIINCMQRASLSLVSLKANMGSREKLLQKMQEDTRVFGEI